MTKSMTYPSLRVENLAGGVQVWRFDRPEQRNSFGDSLFADLLDASRRARDDDAIRVVVTTGVGPTYCVGADGAALDSQQVTPLHDLYHDEILQGRMGDGLASRSRTVRFLEDRGVGRWVEEFLRLDKPLIAALNGAAAGGGFALSLLHDFRIAAPGVRLCPVFCELGVAPEMGASWLLPRLIGAGAAAELLLVPGGCTAERALELGLVHRVAADPVAAAVELGRQIAQQSAPAVMGTVRLLRAAGETTFDEQLGREFLLQRLLFETEEFRAAASQLGARVMKGAS